jgi:hypothetical protein
MASDAHRPPGVPPALPPPLPGVLPPAIPLRLPSLTVEDLRDLKRAKELLENPGLPARLAAAIGRPLEGGFKMLPGGWQKTVARATQMALDKALTVAISSLDRHAKGKASERWHKVMVGASGGVGGVFGLAALPVELPLSTTLMLRSIADIARSEGHDLSRAEVQLNCLEVFALGGPAPGDDAVEGAYWAVRTTLAKAITEAATYLGQRGAIDHAAPALVRFVGAIAARFGVVVSEEIAAKAVPVVGAAAGAVLNVVFMDHFQSVARGHFIVKRLEAKYGSGPVRAYYDSIALRMRSP